MAELPPAAQILTDQPDKYQTSKYWGDQRGRDLGTAVLGKITSFQQFMIRRGYPQKWAKSQQFYYGRTAPGIYGEGVPGIAEFGPDGQFKYLSINHFRALLKNILSIQTTNPPTPRCVPVNSDAASLRDASLYRIVLDYYVKELELLDKFIRVGESAAIFDSGFLFTEWEGSLEPFDPSKDRSFWDGTPRVVPFTPWDVFYDPTKPTWRALHWVGVREYVNKFELAERYKDKADTIVAKANTVPASNSWDSYRYDRFGADRYTDFNDDIPIYRFLHEKRSFMPHGKYCIFLDDGTPLKEDDLPFDQIPIERFALDEHIQLLTGCTPGDQLIGPQENINILESAITTNLANFATQFVAVERGTGFNPATTKEGLSLLEYPKEAKPPVGINLTAMPEGAFQQLQNTVNNMNLLVGVSLSSRGVSPGPEFSGKANQVMINQTAQNQGPTGARYADFQGKSYTQLFRVLKKFARNEKTIGIAGIHNGGTETWLNETLTNFDRVICEPGNPAMATPEGKTNILLQILQYAQGRLDPNVVLKAIIHNSWENVIEEPRDQDIWIQQETEMLMQGIPCMVNAFDPHQLHISDHMQVLNNADFRNATAETDPVKFQHYQQALQHIFEHFQMMQGAAQPQAPQSQEEAPAQTTPSQGGQQ